MTPVATYRISSGILLKPSGAATGLWSGHGEGYNNAALCNQKGLGPLPPGFYTIGPLEACHANLGPDVMSLTQVSGASYGRGSFYIHGASALHPGNSSDGCIIMPRDVRRALASDVLATGNARLEVTP